MALIGKIREKSWLVLVLVGGALAAFILGDWQNMFSGTDYEFGYGTVYGEKVDMNAFEQMVQKQQRIADMNAEAQGQQAQQVNRDQLWTSFVEDILLTKEFEALGIDVSDEELDAYLYARDGFMPLPDLAQNFKDSLGQFNPQMLQARITEMENSEDPKQQEIWKNYRESLVDRRKQEKYKDLLAQTVYITELQAKDEYLAQQEVKSISYVLHRYSSIDNKEIDDSDEKLKAYFEEHKDDKDYEIKDAMRELKYIDFMLDPSGEDSTEFENKLAKIKSEFATTNNDSTFVVQNSESRMYTSGPYSTAVPQNHPNANTLPFNYPVSMDTVFANSNVGDIIGPYQNQGIYNIAKVIGFTKDTINARHILIPVEQGKELAADKLADSILGVINSDNFTQFVDKYSTDTGSKAKGGELGDFFFTNMVAPFAIYCADQPIGKIGKVRSQFGIHIIEVLDRRGKSYPRLAVVQQSLTPSQDAIDNKEKAVYDLLFNMSAEMDKKSDGYEKVKAFDTLAAKENHFPRVMRIMENKPVINGLNSVTAQNSILKLAFSDEAQVGSLVGSPIRDKNRLVLAVVSGVKEKGVGSFEEMKEKIRSNYIRDKKAEMLIAKMSKAKSLGELEDQAKGIAVQQAEVTFSAPQIRGAGTDPKIVGAIFSGLKDGETTTPIQGNMGVYVVKIEKTTKAPAAANYDKEKDQLTGSQRSIVQSKVMDGLKKRADVVDNRKFFEANIRR